MAGLVERAVRRLQGNGYRWLAASLAADETLVARATTSGLEYVVCALARYSADRAGALNLCRVLDDDIELRGTERLGDIVAQLAHTPRDSGNDMLGILFGSRRGVVEAAVARESGLDIASVSELLPSVAMVAVDALNDRREYLSSSWRVARILAAERTDIEQRTPDRAGIDRLLDGSLCSR